KPEQLLMFALSDLEVRLAKLSEAHGAMLAASRLAKWATHYGYAARGDDANFDAINSNSEEVLAYFAEAVGRLILDARQGFEGVVSGGTAAEAPFKKMRERTQLGFPNS